MTQHLQTKDPAEIAASIGRVWRSMSPAVQETTTLTVIDAQGVALDFLMPATSSTKPGDPDGPIQK